MMIFSIAQLKNMLIEDAYQQSNGNVNWDIKIVKNLNDWEISNHAEILKVLSSQQISSTPNIFVWKFEESERFSIRSYYNF